MSISFQHIYRSSRVADWMTQDFQGFQLDSRHVTAGQIFMALTSLSQPEKTAQFAQAALDQGALAVISETELAVANNLVVPDVRQRIGQWQKQYLQTRQPVPLARMLAVTGTNGKTTISRLIAELLMLQAQRCAVMGTTGNGILPN